MESGGGRGGGGGGHFGFGGLIEKAVGTRVLAGSQKLSNPTLHETALKPCFPHPVAGSKKNNNNNVRRKTWKRGEPKLKTET